MKVLLDASYSVVDGKPTIDLFYKPESDIEDKQLVSVKDFDPYFYAIPSLGSDADVLIDALKEANFPQIKKLEKVRLIDMKDEKDVVKVVTLLPKNVPEIRDRIGDMRQCREVREAAIRFTQRYLIDADLTPMKGVADNKPRIASFDIETYHAGGTGEPILMISYADTKGLEKVWTYKNTSELDFVETLADEKEMIQRFMDTVKQQKIDILLTYNGDNFDFGFIKDRCDKYGIPFILGADGSQVKLERRGMDMGARVTGRPHVDLYPVCRRVFNLPRYTLEDVYASIFGEEKRDINVEDIVPFWDSGDPEKLAILFDYSMEDAKACLKIGLEVLPLEYELSQLIGQPMFEVSRMSSGNKVEWLLMRRAKGEGLIVPNRPDDREMRERALGKYEGAYVVEPDKGIHENILVFDFKSLYPSIIIAHNVDPATINCDCCKAEGDAWVSPSGARFCKKKKGFVPGVLEDVIKSRTRTKIELKKLRELNSQDKVGEKMLDAKQLALKILANSFYGYMGYARARWYSRECASAVTAWGRDYIKKTIEKANAEGMKVVYGDTDSLLITLPEGLDEKAVLKRKNEFLSRINKALPPAMELEFEGFYTRGLFVTKKRYALMDSNKKLTVKGLETKRRDWAIIAKRTQEEVLRTVLWEKNPEKAAEIVKATIQDLRDKKIPLKDLIIHTQLTKNLGQYANVAPHVYAAKKAQKRGKTIHAGDVIQYIITRRGKSISEKAEMLGFVDENDYDAEYYINNQLLPAVMRILEALGYKEEELKGLGRQMTLGGFS